MAILADKKKKVYDPYKVGGPEERAQSKMNNLILDGAKTLAVASGSKQMHDAFIGANKTAKAPLLGTTVMNKFFGEPTSAMAADTNIQSSNKKTIGIGSGNPGTGFIRREDTGETFTFDGSSFRGFDKDGNSIDKTMSPVGTASGGASTAFDSGKVESGRFAGFDKDLIEKSDRAHQEQYMRRIEGGGMVPIYQGIQNKPAFDAEEKKPLKMGWKERTARATNAAENRSRERIAAMVSPGEEAQAAALQADTQMAPLRRDMLQKQYDYFNAATPDEEQGVSPESAIERMKRKLRELK